MQERIARLDAAITEDRLIRHCWTEGHDRMCLLTALSPEVEEDKSTSSCPAEVMPPWLAELTPGIGADGTDGEVWDHVVRRYAAAVRRWHVLSAEDWEEVRVGWLADCVLPKALSRVTIDDWGVRDAVEGVRRALRGDGDLNEAGRAAESAGAAASRSARRASAWASASAAWASASASWASAWASAEAAALRSESWDHMTADLLGRIEDACAAKDTADGEERWTD